MVGHDVRNRQNISSINRCGRCQLILRDPAQLLCAHRECKSCIDDRPEDVIKCSTCGEDSPKAKIRLDKGFKNDMNLLNVGCSFCAWDGLLKVYEAHLNEVHPNPKCEHCGENFLSAASLNLHKLDGCTKITVPCALKDYGCSEAVTRIYMADHYRTIEHQYALVAFISQWSIKPMLQQYDTDSTMEIEAIPQYVKKKDRLSIETDIKQLQDAEETISIIHSGLQTLHGDIKKLYDDYVELNSEIETYETTFLKLKKSIEEQSSIVDGFQLSQGILFQELSNMKQRIDEKSQVSYDGMLIWKISDFKNILGQARSERQTSLHSPSFYSSPTGYKMRVRLYPNGDGTARGTHISLFFFLMRSEYDAILKFPFNYKIIFCLYDQTSNQRHIVESFRPDTQSNSFQRPLTDINVASGIPKFVPLSSIDVDNSPYVRDDTMFIKVIVEFIEIPKHLVKYALSIDPALPITAQHNYLSQEKHRTEQTSTSLSTSATLQNKP